MITDSVLEKYKTRMVIVSSSSNAWFISSGTFRSYYDPGVDLNSDRNDYQVYFLGVKSRCVILTTLSSPCADGPEIWDLQLSGTLRSCPVLYSHCFTFILRGDVNIQNEVCCVTKMPTQLATFPLYNSQVWPMRAKSKGLHKSPPVDHTIS